MRESELRSRRSGGGWQQADQGQEVWDDACGVVVLLSAQGTLMDELEYGSCNGIGGDSRTGEH